MIERTLDVICLGRAAVDLYGQQLGGRFEDVQSFAKYVGGSSANVAFGLARLGRRSSMLSRVGDEAMGRFVREAMNAAGVDVSHLSTDPSRLTGLVLLGIEGRSEFPHIFYRERCADLGLVAEDFDEQYIGSSRMLAITGTHLSTESTAQAVNIAIAHARAAGTAIVFDIDYRPVLWGLASVGDGANRFIESAAVTAAMSLVLPQCSLIVGTEEEICIAGGDADVDRARDAIRAISDATLVIKRGAAGCTVYPQAAAAIDVPGFPVELLNTLGAGDAFLTGFLDGLLAGRDWRECAIRGNACGALVVSRHGCAPALPSHAELTDFLARAEQIPRPERDAELVHLHAATTTRRPRRDLYVLAFDHRRQLEQLAAETDQPLGRIVAFKGLVGQAVDRVAARGGYPDRLGVIVDDRYGTEVLSRMNKAGRWVGRAIEIPGSRPVEFEPRNHIATTLLTWPVADVIKCLVFYHPDDPLELRLAQEERVIELYRDSSALERELLLEIVVATGEHTVAANTITRILRRFYNLGVRPAWWKLEPPSAEVWPEIMDVILRNDPHCNGVLLLGLDASEAALTESFRNAAPYSICRGFAVGRTIFGQPARDWLGGLRSDEQIVEDIAARYQRLIGIWQSLRP